MRYLLPLVAILSYNNVIAQNLQSAGFVEGIVIKKSGDTLHYLIERAISYTDYVKCKLSNDGQEYGIPVKDIRTIILPHKYLEVVQLGKQEQLLTLVAEGKIDLYNYMETKEGATEKIGRGTVTRYSYIDHYIVKTGNEYLEIEKKKFTETLLKVLDDCPAVTGKLNENAYRFEDMVTIIKDYNNCGQ